MNTKEITDVIVATVAKEHYNMVEEILRKDITLESILAEGPLKDDTNPVAVFKSRCDDLNEMPSYLVSTFIEEVAEIIEYQNSMIVALSILVATGK